MSVTCVCACVRACVRVRVRVRVRACVRDETRRDETGFGEKDMLVVLTALNCNDEWRRLRRDE